MDKKSFRQEMKSRLKDQSLEDRDRKSLLLKDKLFGDPTFKKARTVLFYVGFGGEVNTVPMIEEAISTGKRVLLPQVDLEKKELKLFEIRDLRSQLRSGPMGIQEPDPSKVKAVAADQVDCVIVPGLAFDKHKRRLGRGAGFYDRFLSTTSARPWGVGWEAQLSAEPVPVGPNDIRMWALCTEDGWRRAETPEAG